MGMFDDMKDKASDMKQEPNKKEKMQKMAKDKGKDMKNAKDRMMDKDK